MALGFKGFLHHRHCSSFVGSAFGVFENLNNIDEIISQNAVGWSINRITKIALAILRLSIYEIKYYDEIPASVSINEAVELAKKYATKEDASFINGILSTVVKNV